MMSQGRVLAYVCRQQTLGSFLSGNINPDVINGHRYSHDWCLGCFACPDGSKRQNLTKLNDTLNGNSGMPDKKNLLIHKPSYDRLKHDLASLNDAINVLVMDEKGEISQDGHQVDPADIEVHLAWLNLELMQAGLFPDYVKLILATQSPGFIQSAAAGFDHPIFMQLINKTDKFCSSDAQAPPIAEFVLASVLYRLQRFDLRVQKQAAKQWQGHQFRELIDSHWVIVGFGNIGQRIAEQVRGFGGRITAVRRRQIQTSLVDRVASLQELPELLPQADVVVLACGLNDETRGVADASFFQAMQEHSILVNIGRGALLDESALIKALDADQLDFAVLDVFEEEPLPQEHSFWEHPRVLVTPHASNDGMGTVQRGDDLFMENITNYLSGKPLRNEVSPDSL